MLKSSSISLNSLPAANKIEMRLPAEPPAAVNLLMFMPQSLACVLIHRIAELASYKLSIMLLPFLLVIRYSTVIATIPLEAK